MIDSILIGMSGLDAFSEGLRTISNNATNLDTPGFKGSTTQFGDLFYQDSGVQAVEPQETGYGVTALGTMLNFGQGELQSDNQPLDLGVNGDGLFTLRDENGLLHYTRDGQFHFDDSGTLVDVTGKQQVVSVDANGNAGVFSMDGMRSNPAQATANVVFNGNLDDTPATTSTGQTGSGLPGAQTATVTVLDRTGVSHSLSMTLTPDAVVPNQWNVDLKDGTTDVGQGSLQFVDGQVDPSSSKIQVSYTPAGSSQFGFTLDFSADVTSFAGANSLAEATNDGRAAGSLTSTTFDSTGTLVFTYSNGQTVKGNRLQLAAFASTDAVTSVGQNEFDAKDLSLWHTGLAGEAGFGSIESSVVELSNVDLSQEFSDLVIVQRGYQASSQVVSTANDMLQELFSMSGNK